jgi:hypothetical protein
MNCCGCRFFDMIDVVGAGSPAGAHVVGHHHDYRVEWQKAIMITIIAAGSRFRQIHWVIGLELLDQ